MTTLARTGPITSAAFHDAHWTRRDPVVVSGAAGEIMALHDGWSPPALFARLRERRADVAENMLWYDTAEGVLLDRAALPAFVADHVYGAAHLTRRNHVRLFVHPRGHVTNLHYEGNLFDVWSAQLAGVKRWRLLRGDRAHKLLPFYFLENQASFSTAIDEPPWTHVIDLQPGEILYVPRGWYHHVECLTDDNVAVSLVSAPRDVGALAGAVTLDTYREQLALQRRLRWVLPARFGAKVDTFITDDADGARWSRHYTDGIRARALLRRLAADVGVTTPRLLAALLFDPRARGYIGYLDRFRDRLRANLEPR